jgi:hypothetical protein
VVQLNPHVDPLQIALPRVAPLLGPGHPAVHEVPHMFCGVGLSQVPLQLSVPVGQPHVPAVVLQTCPAAHPPHVAPPLPQLSVVSLASGSHVVALLQHPAHPLLALQTHFPAPEHTVPGLVVAHALLHAPQLLLSDSRFTHDVPQGVSPVMLQLTTQAPLLQLAVAPVTFVVQT